MGGIRVWGVLVSVALWATACTEDFDPPTLVDELRILAIRAEPPDLVSGESTLLTALVAAGDDEAVSYQWEWCPVNEGPNNGFACVTDGLGLPEEAAALFDLGTEATALMPYPGDAEFLRELCEQVLASLETLPELAELPDCEVGAEVVVRLTVRAGELEKVAVKRVFLWFEQQPDTLRRNRNPRIDRVFSGSAFVDESLLLRAAPGSEIPWFVEVDPAVQELFLARDLEDDEPRHEEVLFSWFSTSGDWDRDRSFADNENFTLREAGQNRLFLPDDAEPGQPVGVFFVIRDGRGGAAWTQRELRVVVPSGAEVR